VRRLGEPKIYMVDGEETKMFTIGQVAAEIDRTGQCLFKWEKSGILPKAQYRTKAGVRLYSETQKDAIVNAVVKWGVKGGKKIPPEFIDELKLAFGEGVKNG
jgi:hypothetical protein